MNNDLLKDFIHDEPPPNWEELEKDIEEEPAIFEEEEEKEEGNIEEDENEWTDIIKTKDGLDTKIRRVMDDLEEPVWEKDNDEPAWNNNIDESLWNDVDVDEEDSEEPVLKKEVKPKLYERKSKTTKPVSKTKANTSTATAKASTPTKVSTSTKVGKSTTHGNTKPTSIPNIRAAKKEKKTKDIAPTPSSSWSIITKTSYLATSSKTIRISLSSIVNSATAEETSSKVSIRTAIPLSAVNKAESSKKANANDIYSTSPDMPGSYPFGYSNKFGGMGHIVVFSDSANGSHHINSLNFLLLFTLVLLFFRN